MLTVQFLLDDSTVLTFNRDTFAGNHTHAHRCAWEAISHSYLFGLRLRKVLNLIFTIFSSV